MPIWGCFPHTQSKGTGGFTFGARASDFGFGGSSRFVLMRVRNKSGTAERQTVVAVPVKILGVFAQPRRLQLT